MLNDGTKVPRGTFVQLQLASHLIHRNEQYYENPETSDLFRFARMREKEGIKGLKHQISTMILPGARPQLAKRNQNIGTVGRMPPDSVGFRRIPPSRG